MPLKNCRKKIHKKNKKTKILKWLLIILSVIILNLIYLLSKNKEMQLKIYQKIKSFRLKTQNIQTDEKKIEIWAISISNGLKQLTDSIEKITQALKQKLLTKEISNQVNINDNYIHEEVGEVNLGADGVTDLMSVVNKSIENAVKTLNNISTTKITLHK